MNSSDPFPWLDEHGGRWDVNRMPTWQTRWRPRTVWPDGAVELTAEPEPPDSHTKGVTNE